MIKDFLKGLVVSLPEEIGGSGVVLHATKQRKNLFLATIMTNKGDVLIAQVINLSGNIGEKIEYLDYRIYSHEIKNLL